MSKVNANRQFQLDMCRVLGLDPSTISEFSITCVAGQPTEIRTVSFVNKLGADVDTIAQTFELVERTDAINLISPRTRIGSIESYMDLADSSS